jgi:hypothetical protein
VEEARGAASDGLWEPTRDRSAAALELLQPGFLPDHDGDLLDTRRREFEELELEALEWLARSSVMLGGPQLAAAERASRTLIERSPYRETGYRFLMEALAEGGNAAEALRVYDRLRLLLRDELGAAPATEVQELHKHLLAGDGARRPSRVEPSRGDGPRRIPLPSLLSPRESSGFVGRDRELEMLIRLWEQASVGKRGFVLIAGEPGIGKTRLAGELALHAHEHGTVLYAGCQQEALISYQPIVEACRHYARSNGLDWPHVDHSPGSRELARLVPEFAGAPSAEQATHPNDPETRRFLLFEAVTRFLAAASARTPVLLVLDDLHWADSGTVNLLRHLIRAPDAASLLIVGTCRESDVRAGHPLAGLTADLRRDRLYERVTLKGLDESDVAKLIASHAGHEASAGLVGTVHERTAGNPFFVEEVMRHLVDSGVLFERDGRWVSARTLDEIGVPSGVKEVLTVRLARLSEHCHVMLSHAAVVGREFSFAIARAMLDADDDVVIAALEEAVDAQLVVEAAARPEPAYAFTHALVRETLYSALSGARRQRLHGRVAGALEAQRGLEPGESLTEIAFHLCEAAPVGADAGRAVELAERAAEWELGRDAYEQVVLLLTRALVLVPPSDGERARRLTRKRAIAFQRLSHAAFDLRPARG